MRRYSTTHCHLYALSSEQLQWDPSHLVRDSWTSPGAWICLGGCISAGVCSGGCRLEGACRGCGWEMSVHRDSGYLCGHHRVNE